MDNLTNVLQEQDDSQVADQTSKTLTEESKSYSTVDLLDPYEKEFWYEEHIRNLH